MPMLNPTCYGQAVPGVRDKYAPTGKPNDCTYEFLTGAGVIPPATASMFNNPEPPPAGMFRQQVAYDSEESPQGWIVDMGSYL
jgi:hypothetical protein